MGIMIELTAIEARLLGVLIEKDKTTPEQYPLSLNAIVNGANQKNNRHPITSIDDNEAFNALESLRDKKLVIRTDVPGQRVNKYRHNAPDVLRLSPPLTAVLAELLLRGPQTLGEIRGRAARMHPLESLDVVKGILAQLMEREEPLVKLLPPSPGSRAERYGQLLSPLDEVMEEGETTKDEVASSSTASSEATSALETRVAALEREVAELKETLRQLIG